MSTSSWTNLLDLIYPIDSVYISVDQYDTPAQLFGGTWVRLDKEACLRSAIPEVDSELNNGFHLGGSDTFTLSAAQLPPHKHHTVDTLRLFNVGGGDSSTAPATSSNNSYTNNDGGFLTGSAILSASGTKYTAQNSISRVPQYVQCFVYRRTA